MAQQTADKVKFTRKRMIDAQSCQNSYADMKHRPIMFEVSNRVRLKLFRWKGRIRLGKHGKLSPHFTKLFKVLQKVGNQSYKLELPPELEGIHHTFHVYYLRKYEGGQTDMIPLLELKIH